MDPLHLVVRNELFSFGSLSEPFSPLGDDLSFNSARFEESSLFSEGLNTAFESDLLIAPEILKDESFSLENLKSSEQSPVCLKPVNNCWEEEKESVSKKAGSRCEKLECESDLNSPSFQMENSNMSSTVSSSHSLQHPVQSDSSSLSSSSLSPQFVPVFSYPSFPHFFSSPCIYFNSNAVSRPLLFSSLPPLPYPSFVNLNDKMSMPSGYGNTCERYVNPDEYIKRLCKNMECLEFHPAAPSREQFCGKKCKHRKGNYSKTKNETNIKIPRVCIRKDFEQWLSVRKRTEVEVEKYRQEGIEKLNKLNEC